MKYIDVTHFLFNATMLFLVQSKILNQKLVIIISIIQNYCLCIGGHRIFT